MDPSPLASSSNTPRSTVRSLHEAIVFIRKDPTKKDDKPGYLYATQEARTGLVKIGHSQDLTARRPEALVKCGHEFGQVYYTKLFNWSYKCEKILHMLLVDFAHPLHKCSCGTETHHEYYKLEYVEAISAIGIVMKWMLLKPEPYLRGEEARWSAKLTLEWDDALKIFEDSHFTSNRLEWLQFFEWKVPSQSITQNGQVETRPRPSQFNSLVRSIQNRIPMKSLTTNHDALPLTGQPNSTSVGSPFRSSKPPAFQSTNSVDGSPTRRSTDGSQTPLSDSNGHRGWDTVDGFMNNDDDRNTAVLSNSRNATEASDFSQSPKLRRSHSFTTTRPTARVLATELRQSKLTPSLLDTSLSLAQVKVTQTSADSVDVTYSETKRGLVTSVAGLKMPYAEHKSVFGTLSKDELGDQAIPETVMPVGNSGTMLRLSTNRVDSEPSVTYNRPQLGNTAEELKRDLGNLDPQDKWSERENDSEAPSPIYLSAPPSPDKQRAPELGLPTIINNRNPNLTHSIASEKLPNVRPPLARSSSIHRGRSLSQVSTPASKLVPFSLSMLESLEQYRPGPEADWQDTPPRCGAVSCPPSPSSTTAQPLRTPPNIMNRPVELDETKLTQTFTALDISDVQRGDDRKNVTLQATLAQSSPASQEIQSNVASIDGSLTQARRSSDPETPAVAKGAMLEPTAVSSGLSAGITPVKPISIQPTGEPGSSGIFANAPAFPTNFKVSSPPPHTRSGQYVKMAWPSLVEAAPLSSKGPDFWARALADAEASAVDVGLLQPLETERRRRSSAPKENSSKRLNEDLDCPVTKMAPRLLATDQFKNASCDSPAGILQR